MDRKTLVAFSSGHLIVAVYSCVNFYLLKFYTDEVALTPLLVGYAFAIRFAVDAVTDPLIGHWSDHSQSRRGRRRPFLLWGAIGSAACLYLVFTPPAGSTTVVFSYLTLTLTLLFVSAGMFQIPLESLAPELTYDYRERTQLSGFRKFFDSTGDMLGLFVVAVLLATLGGEETASSASTRSIYSLAAGVLAVVVLAAGLAAYFGTREEAGSKCSYGFFDGMRNTWNNRAFRVLLVSTVLATLGLQIAGSQLLFILEHFFNQPEDALPGVLLCFFAGTMVSIWAWTRLAHSLGKKGALTLAMLFAAAAFIALPSTRWPDAMIYVMAFMVGAGMAGVQGLAFAIWPDLIEWDERITGQRREGSYAAMRTFVTKLSLGGGLLAVGYMLTAIGYQEGKQPSPETVTGLRMSFAVLPASLLVAGAIALQWFPITEESHQQLLRELGRSTP